MGRTVTPPARGSSWLFLHTWYMTESALRVRSVCRDNGHDSDLSRSDSKCVFRPSAKQARGFPLKHQEHPLTAHQKPTSPVEQESSKSPVTCGAGVAGHLIFGTFQGEAFLGTFQGEANLVEQEVSKAR